MAKTSAVISHYLMVKKKTSVALEISENPEEGCIETEVVNDVIPNMQVQRCVDVVYYLSRERWVVAPCTIAQNL